MPRTGITCLHPTLLDYKKLNEFLKEFPFMESVENLIDSVNVWLNENLNDDEDRLPTIEELKQYFINTGRLLRDGSMNKNYEASLLIKASLKEKLAHDLNPNERRQYVGKLARLFKRVVQDEYQDLLSKLKARIDKELNPKVRLELVVSLEHFTTALAAKNYPHNGGGVEGIFRDIYNTFKDWLNQSDDVNILYEIDKMNDDPSNTLSDNIKLKIVAFKVKNKRDAYQKIVDNYTALIEEASANFGYITGITIDFNDNTVISWDLDIPVINQYGEVEGEFDLETQPKEHYMTNVREVSSWSRLTNRVREAISDIARVDSFGEIETDIIGDTIFLNSGYVHAELIQALNDMISAEDMIPLLLKLAIKKPWANQIIDAITGDDWESASLFTDMYRVYRKDALNYWMLRTKNALDGGLIIETIPLNKTEGTAHYFDEWRDNQEYGIILDKENSVYDKNGNFILDNAKEGKKIIDKIVSDSAYITDREAQTEYALQDSTLEALLKALQMLGINVSPAILEASLLEGTEDTKQASPFSRLKTALSTIYNDLSSSKNDAIKNGLFVDFINLYGTQFNNIASIISNVDERAVESSCRVGKKTRYAHVNPSYATTLAKKIRNDLRFQELLNLLLQSFWFYKDGKIRNAWLRDYAENPDARHSLEHIVLLEYGGKDYSKWSELDAVLALYSLYNVDERSKRSGKEEITAYYLLPVLADSASAEFLKGKRYVKDYEKKIIELFREVVYLEIDRIELVKIRANDDSIAKFANFDVAKKKNKIIKGGSEFKFLPELNEVSDFLETIDLLKQNGSKSDIDTYIDNEVAKILNVRFKNAIARYRQIGVFERVDPNNPKSRFKYFNKFTDESLIEDLKEYYYNTTFALSLIIQLLLTDLAYSKDLTKDFPKRAKQFHAPSEKLNTLATWNGKPVLTTRNGVPRKERTITLADFIKPSDVLEEVKQILDEDVRRGVKSQLEANVIYDVFKKVNVADAQALRSLKSNRTLSIMAGMWSDDAELAYNNFRDGKYSAKDFTILWNVTKPYLYTQDLHTYLYNNPDGSIVQQTLVVPSQNKNSEALLVTLGILASVLSRSPKLKALSDFMEKYDIDVVQFESAYKIGLSNPIDINSATTYEEVTKILEEATGVKTIEDKSVIREHDFNDYGIQTATPIHFIDEIALYGTQLRRLISADHDPNTVFEYNGRKFTVQLWLNYYNAVNTANIIEAAQRIDLKFSDPKLIEKELKNIIRKNPQYGTDLLDAVTLVDGLFNIPLNDPSQTLRLQSLLNSFIRSNITKQKIKGGSLIQVSSYGLEEKYKPRLVYENGRLKYAECYIPCPSEELYNLLVDPKTHEIDINKKDASGKYIVPQKYREMIGYRIPTEDKHSMLPLKVKGFLPRACGGVIILPEDITAIAGSDFDVDKMFIMTHEIRINRFDMDLARHDYNKYIETVKASGKLIAGITLTEDLNTEESFGKWFNKNKNSYKLDLPTASVVQYDFGENIDPNDKVAVYKQAKKNSKAQRDSLNIDLVWSVLTNKDTAGKVITPSNFDKQKAAARLITLLLNTPIDLIDRYKIERNGKTLKGFEALFDATLDELENFVAEFPQLENVLTPDTWVKIQQRMMSGASLVPMAALNNAALAYMLLTLLSVKPEYSFKFNGKIYNSLHEQKTKEGDYIIGNVGGFLAAFVDNGKDPIAGDMNFNTLTANIGFALARLGVLPKTIALILSLPIVKKVVDNIVNLHLSMPLAIDDAIKYYKSKRFDTGFDFSEKGITNTDFTDEMLAGAIAAEKTARINGNMHEHYFYDNLLKVGYFLSKFNKVAEALNDITQATRQDTQAGGAGPYVSSNVLSIMKIEKVLTDMANEKYPLNGVEFLELLYTAHSEEDVINSPLPILAAFMLHGLLNTSNYLKQYFPYYSDTYRTILSRIINLTKYGNIDAATANAAYNEFVNFMLTRNDEMIKVGDLEVSKRDYYINYFPAEFGKFKEEHPELVQDLPLLGRLQYLKRTAYNPAPAITFHNVGTMTDILKQIFVRDWESLYNISDETRDIAIKLFEYCCYKGLTFQMNGFSNLIPSLIKTSQTDYILTLRDVFGDTTEDLIYNYVMQFVRHHLNNRNLVADVTSSSVTNNIKEDSSEFMIEVTQFSPKEERGFVKYFDDDKIPQFMEFVHVFKNGKDYYFRLSDADGSTAIYERIEPLGVSEKQRFLEYDYNQDALDIHTVISAPKDYRSTTRVNVVEDAPIDYDSMPDDSEFLTWADSFTELDAISNNTTIKKAIISDDLLISIAKQLSGLQALLSKNSQLVKPTTSSLEVIAELEKINIDLSNPDGTQQCNLLGE